MHSTSSANQAVARPTQLIAEALVERHDSMELSSRAKRLGLPRDLTEAVIKVCCREGKSGQNAAGTPPTIS